MREIKFRVWNKELHLMLKGITLNSLFYSGVECAVNLAEPNYPYEFCIPMQYAGLQDKNGKEIYDGDYVTFYADYGGDGVLEPREEIEFKGLVVWSIDGCGFGVQTELCKAGEVEFNLWVDSVGQWEVIGNIYENPELLSA